MQLVYRAASRLLMQAVDVLRDHRRKRALGLELGEFAMRSVRLGITGNHAVEIELEELRRMPIEIRPRDHLLGRNVAVFLRV